LAPAILTRLFRTEQTAHLSTSRAAKGAPRAARGKSDSGKIYREIEPEICGFSGGVARQARRRWNSVCYS
jgi:hypothetical protein